MSKQTATIIGVGKLGLCFALTLEHFGKYNVVGIEPSTNNDYVNDINDKRFKSSEAGVEYFLRMSQNFKVTSDIAEGMSHSNIIFVTVATPSLSDGYYDHSQVENVIASIESLGRQLEKKHVVICCTVMPGYCDTIKQRLNDLNCTVSYNPEFIAIGSIMYDQRHPDIVLIGEENKESGDVIEDVYRSFVHANVRYCRMSLLEAELTKISLNCFLTTKIAYANMIGDIATKIGARPDVILSAIGSDDRIGCKYLKYGFGFGGPCFPRDNRALALFARDNAISATISNATDKANEEHLAFQVNDFTKNNSINDEVLITNVTYKSNTTMIVESQQLKFAVNLAKLGYKIKIAEKSEVIDLINKEYGNLFAYEVLKI